MSNVPENLLYAKSHEWLREGQGTVTVGISDHAQHELTDVVFVELPEVGRKVAAGEACAVVESVKTASDIYSPIAGEVIAVNERIVADPGLVNADPFGDGWFFQIRPDKAIDASALLTAAAYRVQIGG